MAKVAGMKSTITGETAPAHYIGTDEQGRRMFSNPGSGWFPIDKDGQAVSVDYDRDGNLIELA